MNHFRKRWKTIALISLGTAIGLAILFAVLAYVAIRSAPQPDCNDAWLIQGRVLRMNSEPVPSAQVDISSLGLRDFCWGQAADAIPDLSVVTDDAGWFRTEYAAAVNDSLQISVTAPGCEPFLQTAEPWDFGFGFGTERQGIVIQLICSSLTPAS